MADGLVYLESSKKMPLVTLPVRTTVAPLSRGRVMLSPGSMLTAEQLAAAGAVTDIVAPNMLHTAGVAAAAKAHPSARLWGPPGVREKHPELAWHGLLGVDAWPHEDELAQVPLAGMRSLHESVFVHRASRTLIVTDLAFNIQDPKGVGTWIIYSLFGTYARFGTSRLFVRDAKDRAAFRESLVRVLALDFDRLAPSHGAVVESDAKAKLTAALRERGVEV